MEENQASVKQYERKVTIASPESNSLINSVEKFVNTMIKPLRFEGGRIKYPFNSWLTGGLKMSVNVWSLQVNYAEVSFNIKLPF